ncbi:MAG: Ribosomal RNA small subunit methyltransferase A [Candidatus Jorgensenbacteria bacterium GW2011_GWA2_45_13]|uniref:Ribosomal RNA small subunit methyltransferase A n=1 Tax=Candidatus Jorgensenbacteria bacterium GW2011_GWA2_45_13 TaxID=1618662 RepID=A0A0G1NB59_9BACT|nr:MAG: Ribosomal RNA small subunit methyltransferase A [Candidatus Jorgensenbacteria bacterium GW2011_GWA2_45_13]
MHQKLGQHFLRNKKTLDSIARTANFQEGDVVIEIGSGHGELTKYLKMQNAKCKIIAIEKDAVLAENLYKKYKDDEYVEIIEGDIRKILPKVVREHKLAGGGYGLVGNIPYYLTAYLFRIIGSLYKKPSVCIFTLQKEVALRITANPPNMNLLASSIQYWGVPEIVGFIPKKSFSPPPKVDSAIIKITTLPMVPDKNKIKETQYYTLAKTLFAHPRKTIFNNLRDLAETENIKKETLMERLSDVGINPANRPQDLNVKAIKKICGIVYNEVDE